MKKIGKNTKKVLSLLIAICMIATFAPLAMAASEPTYNHIDVRLNATYKIPIDGTSYTLDATVVSGSATVVDPDGKVWTDFNDHASADGRAWEYRLMGIAIPRKWDAEKGMNGEFKISCKIAVSAAEMGKIPNYESLFEANLAQGTYVFDVQDYVPTENVCGPAYNNGNNSSRGYDFEVHPEAVAMTITKGKLGIQKKVIDENEATLSVTDTFYFTVYHSGPDGSVGAEVTSVQIALSDESMGYATVEDLQPGWYIVFETTKDGYRIQNANGVYFELEQKEDAEIPVAYFTNMKLNTYGAISIEKNTNMFIGDYIFDVYASDNGEKGALLASVTVDSENTSQTDVQYDFLPGDYIIVERDASQSGYTLTTTYSGDGVVDNDGYAVVTVTEGTNVLVTATNVYTEIPPEQPKDPANITISKAVSGTGTPENGTFGFDSYVNGTLYDAFELGAPGSKTYEFTNMQAEEGAVIKVVEVSYETANYVSTTINGEAAAEREIEFVVSDIESPLTAAYTNNYASNDNPSVPPPPGGGQTTTTPPPVEEPTTTPPAEEIEVTEEPPILGEYEPSDPTPEVEEEIEIDPELPPLAEVPSTSDSGNIALMIVIAMAALAGIVLVFTTRKKGKN